jgi:hypothetical integral membrane protein (TIGR02206 family)
MLPPEHLIPLFVIAAGIALVLVVARWRRGPLVEHGARVIAVAVVLAEFAWWVLAIAQDRWSFQYNLPLHLCEVGCFVLAAALWWRKQFAFEVAYFWGLGGTLPGLFTPSIPGHFPDAVYFQYYAEHGLVVLGALYLVLALGMRPARGAVLRVFTATVIYAVAVWFVDLATNGNYLFLRYLPPTKTALDYMGPWPWYLVTGTVLAILVMNALYMPFARSAAPAQQRTG